MKWKTQVFTFLGMLFSGALVLASEPIVPVKLTESEAVLLIKEIHDSAVQKKLKFYIWDPKNFNAILADGACKDLLQRNLISGIKSEAEENVKYSEVEVEVRMTEVEGKEQKTVLVRYRGEGGDSNITYFFKQINGNLTLGILAISILEIMRTTE